MNKDRASGLIEGYKHTPMKVNRVRPQFNSQGQLLTVKSNKIEIKEVPIVQGSTNEEQKSTYKGMTQVLLEHTEISVFSNDLNSAMREMIIDEEEESNIELQSRLQPRRYTAKYEDHCIQDQLSKINMPLVAFK